ncbi:MAG: methyltransferase domain-containing protein [Ruminococcus sp.]|nr:methyltransferase domain-containing protein [Candidatus Apopatosoma intestinale]
MKSDFSCPVCGKPLARNEKTLSCENGHTYDLARKGYVNLLLSQQSKDKRHGDDTIMIAARRDFLDSGAYAPLREKTAETVLSRAKDGDVLLDVGCGECYYTEAILRRADETGLSLSALGIDISKEALAYAHKRTADVKLAVASIFSLPVADESVDLLLNMFAPYAPAEFARVLTSGGYLIRTFPREKHLWELKQAVYDTPYENEIETVELSGFDLIREERITYPLALTSPEQIGALFRMTPYYYKTSKEGQARAAALEQLTVTADFALITYRKKA